jgi:anti-anti-sigma factor
MLKIYVKNWGTAAVLSLHGRIVIGETEILREAVDSLDETSAVILDLAQATIVDAHGLGVMLELRERTHARGMRFELMNASKPVTRVLEITRLDTVFKMTSVVEFFPSVSLEQGVRVAALRPCA